MVLVNEVKRTGTVTELLEYQANEGVRKKGGGSGTEGENEVR